MTIKGTCVSPTRHVDLTSINLLLSSGISPLLYLSPPVSSVHFGIQMLWWHDAVKAILRGINLMPSRGWLPHQPSHAFDNVLTLIFDGSLVIVIPSDVLDSV